MIIYFGLGSNLGNRLQNLRDGLEKLKTLGKIISCSNVYNTSAWGGIEQPDYLNACVKLEAENNNIKPLEILKAIKTFENEIGRIQSVHWGARKIDIDILLVDDMIYKSEELNIPHVYMPERLFVLVPLKDILPENWKHPENGLKVCEMISRLKNEAYPVRITKLYIS